MGRLELDALLGVIAPASVSCSWMSSSPVCMCPWKFMLIGSVLDVDAIWRPACDELAHAVGGTEPMPEPELTLELTEGRMRAWCRARLSAALASVSLTDRASGCGARAVVDTSEPAEVRLDSTREEICLVKGDGASSSSLSLHPRPVVSPRPPRRSRPSRWRTRRRVVSRSSL